MWLTCNYNLTNITASLPSSFFLSAPTNTPCLVKKKLILQYNQKFCCYIQSALYISLILFCTNRTKREQFIYTTGNSKCEKVFKIPRISYIYYYLCNYIILVFSICFLAKKTFQFFLTKSFFKSNLTIPNLKRCMKDFLCFFHLYNENVY